MTSRPDPQTWEKEMRRALPTARQIREELGVGVEQLARMRVTGQIGWVTLGVEKTGVGERRNVRRLLRYAPYCPTHESYQWCRHNGGCVCKNLDVVHPPHL